MPRLVDHDARRREIAAALWRVVRRDGIDQVSVRTVAAEAGTSPGALRHYFASNDELAAFSLRAVVAAAETRLVGLLPGRTGRDAAVTLLEQYLPLDDERRDELAVWFGFLGRPPTAPALRRVREAAEARSREGVAVAVDHLAGVGAVHPGRDREACVAGLYPLVDGLALHGTLWPERYPPAHLRAVLARAVDDLASAPGSPPPS